MDDGLEEPQVLHMLAMALNAVDKVLNHLLVHFVAENSVVLRYSTAYTEIQNYDKTPERWHTWSWHAASLDSGTARGVCGAAPIRTSRMVARSTLMTDLVVLV